MVNLPDILELKRTMRSLATLDLILSPEWEFRYYSFSSKWAPDEQMGSMRNGSGDEWFVLFQDSNWAGLVGWDHESPAAIADEHSRTLQASVPKVLSSFSTEPAFSWERSTFCYWLLQGQSEWSSGPVPDGLETGASSLLDILTSGVAGYLVFAAEYFEANLDPDVVKSVYLHEPITATLLGKINSEVTLDDIREELDEIGYPYSA